MNCLNNNLRCLFQCTTNFLLVTDLTNFYPTQFKVKYFVSSFWFYYRMEELEVQDLDFLHGCPNPTIILIHQDLNGRHVKTHEISLKDKEFVKVKLTVAKTHRIKSILEEYIYPKVE